MQKLILPATMDDIGLLEPFVSQAARLAALSDLEALRLRLAVEEAVANIINYGQATTITLLSAMETGHLLLTIIDDGRPFDPTTHSATDLTIPADQRPPGGLGIVFLRQMTTSIAYERSDSHNVLRIVK